MNAYREIKHLHLVVDSHGNDGDRVTGAVISSCIGAISRQCPNVHITLSINSAWLHFMKQLEETGLPNVTKLIMFAGSAGPDDPAAGWRNSSWDTIIDFAGHHASVSCFWELVFSGSTFPDLRSAYVNTTADSDGGLPATLIKSIDFSEDRHDFDLVRSETLWDAAGRPGSSTPLYGLRNMQEIVLAHNTYLDIPVMESLFNSDIIPRRLTRLEIVDCPKLHAVDDLAALSTLLQRALQLVQHLKLHLCKMNRSLSLLTSWELRYTAKINEHPEQHLCNIIRQLGQQVRSLDVALPHACSNIFTPPAEKAKAHKSPQNHAAVSLEPYGTLASRTLAAGYKYRRLILWHELCRDACTWHDMVDIASKQGSDVSWELIHGPRDSASWHVGGCLPLLYTAEEMLHKPFAEAE